MVYRGPSKDCLPCRRRKLKCDLRKDGCGQCLRAGISCFGYRDSNDLVFRDQTRSVERKMLAAKATTVSLQFGTLDHVILPNASSLPPQLHQPWHYCARHDARHSFFEHYVFGLSSSFDILPLLYENAKPDDHLSASVDAASLAYAANRYHDASQVLFRLAAQQYTIALRRINAALSEPELASADSTLQSILLLDLYEKIVGRDLKAATPWLAHLNGALALIKTRGYNDMTRSRVSRTLANKLFTTLLISCLILGHRIPEGVVELGRRLEMFHAKDDLKWQISKMNQQTINFRVDIAEGRLSKRQIVAGAKRLHDAYREIEETSSQRWQPRRVMASEVDLAHRSLIFGGEFLDLYKDHYTTQVRNTIRIMHLQLQSYIQDNLEDDGSDEYARAREESLSRTEQFAEQVIASVPQFIIPGIHPNNSIPFSSVQTLKCGILLPALFTAAGASKNPDLRLWAIRTLRYMAAWGDMKSARMTADMLEEHPELDFQSMYAKLGGYAFTS
ncbi:Zn2Cys6 transcriptional regulator [Trichoderma parareesei]|uniref:Zn2Cys6 transcriptional regulator n=1 Tax=Trichoderma parareesei TaxID=858221 RepID=A0A2H2ZPI1_TRIPA|nr:Zn2Cys6 transcriptional regulator [Trichoderma parareesei]